MSRVGKLTEGCQNYCDLPITQQFPIDPYSAATSSNRITSTLFIGEDIQHFKSASQGSASTISDRIKASARWVGKISGTTSFKRCRAVEVT